MTIEFYPIMEQVRHGHKVPRRENLTKLKATLSYEVKCLVTWETNSPQKKTTKLCVGCYWLLKTLILTYPYRFLQAISVRIQICSPHCDFWLIKMPVMAAKTAVPRVQKRQVRNLNRRQTKSELYGKFGTQNQTLCRRNLFSLCLRILLQRSFVSDSPRQRFLYEVGQWLRIFRWHRER